MNQSKFFRKKIRAFTLQEVLVTLIIVGILTAIAIPQFLPMITKAKSTEAKLQLKQVFNLQKTYFYEHSTYSNELVSIGYEHAKLVKDGGSANYLVEIVNAGPAGFKARATAQTDFDGDGQLNVWEVDQESNITEVVPD